MTVPGTRAGRAAGALGAVLLQAVLLGACSGASPGTAGTSPAGTPTTTGGPPSPSTSPAVLPLTGLPGSSDRPAVVVKIENSAAARPQSGLADADLVVEQLVEGGITRFAAFYQSKDPGTVGPVRSIRNVDAAIAGPTRGVLAFSGAARVARRAVAAADVRFVEPGDVDGAFSRSARRPAPHNLYLDVSRIWDAPGRGHDAAPPPYLPFGPLPDGVTGEAVARATVRFSAASAPVWDWHPDSGRWRRSERAGRVATDADGSRIVADSVLVVRVRLQDAGYRDPAGNPVPASVLTGEGEAVLLTDGTAVTGRWAKDSADAPLTLGTPDGTPLPVPPGRTWIELLPTSARLGLT